MIDRHSRFDLSWRLSNTIGVRFFLDTVQAALQAGRPEIFNTDQGCRFTARAFTGRLEEEGVAISMDGRGRALWTTCSSSGCGDLRGTRRST